MSDVHSPVVVEIKEGWIDPHWDISLLLEEARDHLSLLARLYPHAWPPNPYGLVVGDTLIVIKRKVKGQEGCSWRRHRGT